VSIGKAFDHPDKIAIVLVQDGRMHGFEIQGTVRWEWTGVAGDGQSTGRVIAEGRFHRKDRAIIEGDGTIELSPGLNELEEP
jgi:hypothetical protein